MKVLLISPYPLQPGKVVGGVEAVASALVPALAAQEPITQVTVLCFQGQSPSHRVKINDKLRIWYLHGQARLTLPTRSFLDVWQARRAAAEIRPDIVHAQGISSMGDIATRISSASVVTVHGLVHVETRMALRGAWQDRLRVRLVDAMVRDILDRARVVISTSTYDARALGGRVRGKSVSISNPVLPEFFLRDESHAGPRILFAGMLIRRKNVEGLLRAFASVWRRLPEARLAMVGPSIDPSYAVQVRDALQALQLGAAVDWMGHVEHEKLLREIRGCRGLVLFSNEETSPTIIAQAMAAGKPVVASRVGGIPDMVVDGESGFLVNPGDEEALADRLAVLIEAPEQARAMGQRGYQIACRRFDPLAVARQTVEAYRSAVEVKND